MSAYSELKTEILDYLRRPGILRPEINADDLADTIIFEGRINDGDLNYEIPSRYTASGNPNAVTFDAVDYEAELEAETN